MTFDLGGIWCDRAHRDLDADRDTRKWWAYPYKQLVGSSSKCLVTLCRRLSAVAKSPRLQLLSLQDLMMCSM